jgi:hypothetical protein
MKTRIASSINHKNTVTILNELFAKLDCSLARYLSYARPWVRRRNMLLDALARRISHEHEAFAGDIARLISDRRGAVRSCVFPMDFTSYNDLSWEYLAPKLLDDERALVGVAEACAERLKDDPEARRVVDRIIASLRRYADLLAELLAPARVAPAPSEENRVSSLRDKAPSETSTRGSAQPAVEAQSAA